MGPPSGGHRRSSIHINSVSAAIARGKRPVTFRTRKLRLSAPMVLRGGPRGRVGHRRTSSKDEAARFSGGLVVVVGREWGTSWLRRANRIGVTPATMTVVGAIVVTAAATGGRGTVRATSVSPDHVTRPGGIPAGAAARAPGTRRPRDARAARHPAEPVIVALRPVMVPPEAGQPTAAAVPLRRGRGQTLRVPCGTRTSPPFPTMCGRRTWTGPPASS